MKNQIRKSVDLVSPRQQRNWDWRAAANFIAGGAGGGLLLWSALASPDLTTARAAILLGLVLIGSGLTCVWFEIGRPWRALNVYRHIQTSWMTREAVVALFVFAAGGWAVLLPHAFTLALAGALGLAFLYSQARILAANKGIPAWRNPASIPLMVATGLVEGCGFLMCVVGVSAAAFNSGLLLIFIALVALRAWFWTKYLATLATEGAPDGAMSVLNGIRTPFVVLGHLAPVLVAVASLAGMLGQGALHFIAGTLAVAGGWLLKYTLVRKAAFTQGLALMHLPRRGDGSPGPQAKPGWKTIASAG